MVIGTGTIAASLDTRNLDLGELLSGNVTASSSTSMTIDEGGGFTAHFTGFGVTYDIFGDPISGTITGISEDYFGTTLYTLTDVNVSASLFSHWVDTNDNFGAETTILAGNDSFTGSPGDDYLESFGGHDYIAGGPGADTLLGDDGNDHLYGQSANGGPDGADLIDGGNGGDYLQGNAGNDTLHGEAGSDRINGGADDDLITGDGGNDTVNGKLGNDSITGGDGNDYLRGGQGNDTIDGGLGDDVISGDKGLDHLIGGYGNDIFQFAPGSAAINGGTDVVDDFNVYEDHLQIGFLPSSIVAGGNATSFSAADTSATQILAQLTDDHHVVAIQVASDTYLFWAGDAGHTVDSAVEIQGVAASLIDTSDFI